MKRTLWVLAVCFLFGTVHAAAASRLQYPSARREDHSESIFGINLSDPYRWLEIAGAPDVKTWVQAEDRLARQWLDALPKRRALAQRLTALYEVERFTVPQLAGHRLFYFSRGALQQKAAIVWREVGDRQAHRLLDPPAFPLSATDSLGKFYPSPDGQKIAYVVKPKNADRGTLRVRDVDSGRENPNDTLAWATYADLSWRADGRGFYYTRISTSTLDPVANMDVRFHVLGTSANRDPEIYPKTGDASVYLTPAASRDGRWLFMIVSRGWSSNDIYVRDEKAAGPFMPLFISTCATASVASWNNSFFLSTNENAPYGKVLKTDSQHLDRRDWQTAVPQRADTVIQSADILGGHLVLRTIHQVSNQIEIRSPAGLLQKQVVLPDIGTVDELQGGDDEQTAYYEFESFFASPQVYRFSVETGSSTIWADTRVPFPSDRYQTRLVSYPSKDGTPISMFVVHRKNAPRDRSLPMLLVAYGGFNEALVPRYNATLLPWLEAGGAVAIPHLRGGGEYGEAWHRAGMLTQKQNTFDDLIAGAEFLIHSNYTRAGLLAVEGASNGGLTVGAVIMQRPDLFRAAICKNPLLDMIRYPMFGEGKAWVPEYGSPEKEETFRALAAYSPYHHVKSGTSYPAMLFLSSADDDRVDPMHARKMTAALQAANTSSHPILLATLRNAGHGGADRIQAQIEEGTDRLGFLFEEIFGRSFRVGFFLEGGTTALDR